MDAIKQQQAFTYLGEQYAQAASYEAQAQAWEAIKAPWAWKAAKAYGGREATTHLPYFTGQVEDKVAHLRHLRDGAIRRAEGLYGVINRP